MKNQLALSFTQEQAFDPRSACLPVSGKTPRARHASHSGALRASKDRGEVSTAYLNLLRTAGPMSDHAAAKALGRTLSTVNSVRNGLGDLVVDSGEYESSEWGTRRTRWTVRGVE